VNFALSLLGVIGAGFAAIMIGFGRSRISLSKVFPHVSFLEAPADLKQKVALLSEKAGISAPGICLIDSGSPSAFTVRANRRYSIAVSVGLLESLEESEIEACLAHEVAHLKNNDFEMRFLATIAKVALFARPLSHFLEPAVYRSREFLADSTAAGLVGGPNALISAISKLKESTDLEPALPNSTCVCNLYSRRRLILRLFDKHPSLEDRLRVLQEMR
jgi:heat shock protein HtpX